MPAPTPPSKPAVDVAALGALVSTWLKSAGRGLAAAITQTRISLGHAATGISHVPTRNFLVKLLTPKVLPAHTGDAFGGLEGKLRRTGEHSEVSSPSLRELRSSGAHSQPAPDLSGGSNPRPSAPLKRVPPRQGGTFTAAASTSGPKHSLTGGLKKLTGDELDAVKHDAARRKDEARARATVDKFRAKLGKFKLEKLGELPRTFAPDTLAQFRQAHPAVTAETLQLVTPLVVGLSRDVCDRAAVHAAWTEAERMAFLASIPAPSKERLKPALEALTAMPGNARQALLRLPRAPVSAQVDALAQKWATVPVEDVRAVALALAQFYGTELTAVIRAPPPPVKVAPKGIRG